MWSVEEAKVAMRKRGAMLLVEPVARQNLQQAWNHLGGVEQERGVAHTATIDVYGASRFLEGAVLNSKRQRFRNLGKLAIKELEDLDTLPKTLAEEHVPEAPTREASKPAIPVAHPTASTDPTKPKTGTVSWDE